MIEPMPEMDDEAMERRLAWVMDRANGGVFDAEWLNTVIRAVMREYPDVPDPVDLLPHVIERLSWDETHLYEALQIALRTQIVRVVGRTRSMDQQKDRRAWREELWRDKRKSDDAYPTPRKWADEARLRGSAFFASADGGVVLPDEVRDMLDDRVSVMGEWKFLRECSAEDLRWLGMDYRSRAEGQAVKGAFFEAVAQQMEKIGAVSAADYVLLS
jgi:hypothetical protein